jgi:hypothetical protein
MRKVNTILCIVAAIGLILGLIVHMTSVMGIYIEDKVPYIWSLHVAIFVVWLPAVLELRKNPELKHSDVKTQQNPVKIFKLIFKDTPRPVMLLSILFLAYAMINIWLVMLTGEGATADIIDGKYVLHNHGDIVKELTEKEYYRYEASTLRGFSGHWMAFYGLAMGILWPKKEMKE